MPDKKPLKSVTFTVFDEGGEWEAIVNFYDKPVNLVMESIEVLLEVMEKAKLEDAGS